METAAQRAPCRSAMRRVWILDAEPAAHVQGLRRGRFLQALPETTTREGVSEAARKIPCVNGKGSVMDKIDKPPKTEPATSRWWVANGDLAEMLASRKPYETRVGFAVLWQRKYNRPYPFSNIGRELKAARAIVDFARTNDVTAQDVIAAYLWTGDKFIRDNMHSINVFSCAVTKREFQNAIDVCRKRQDAEHADATRCPRAETCENHKRYLEYKRMPDFFEGEPGCTVCGGDGEPFQLRIDPVFGGLEPGESVECPNDG